MAHISSGNQIVDAMGKINITGNVIPQIWYNTITRPNGKPYLLAISLLSDIVYWYRPSEVRDENSGQLIGWRKRFHGDLLQRSYQQYADLYGESKRSVKAALDRLEELGVIEKHFRDVTCDNGAVLINVMYISLHADILRKLTYPEMINVSADKIVESDVIRANEQAEVPEYETDGTSVSATLLQNNVGGGTKECTTFLHNNAGYGAKECTTSPQNNVGDGTKECMTSPQNNAGGGTKFCRGYDEIMYEVPQNDVRGGTMERITYPQNIVPGHTTNCKTNTENKTEITNRDYIYPINPIYHEQIAVKEKMDVMDEIAVYKKIIKENIDYSSLRREMGYQGTIVDEIVDLLSEIVCVPRESVRVGGMDYPHQLVKSRFLKLNYSHIRYVIDCMHNNTSKVGNIRAYLLTALFNAPNTIEHYYQAEVNHDFQASPGEWEL